MKLFSAITLSWFTILNIYDKHKWHTGKGRDFWFIRMRTRPNCSSFLTWTIVLTSRYCILASDPELIQINQQQSALSTKLSTIYCLSHSKYQTLCTAYHKYRSTILWWIFSRVECRMTMTSKCHKQRCIKICFRNLNICRWIYI